MNDPFGSMRNMISQFQRFVGNPMQFMLQNKMDIPQNCTNDPNAIIQHLMNSGQLSQQQFEWAKNTAQQIQNNPAFMSMFKNQK